MPSSGKTWNFSATIGDAKDFPWSGEGFNEGGLAIAADGKTIVTASRTGAGDYTPAAACLGYFDYHLSRSTDSGLSWSFPRPIVGAGSCSPNLLNIGGSLILGGGRMCGNATTDVFLWLDEDGMGDPDAFVPYSLSYWYNKLQTNASAPRFDNLINTTCRDEDNGMISVKALSNTTGSVTFDLDVNHKDLYFTMNFSVVPAAPVPQDRVDQEPGATAGPGSVPLGRDKSDCVSWFGAAVTPTTINSSGSIAAALMAPPPSPPVDQARSSLLPSNQGANADPPPIPTIGKPSSFSGSLPKVSQSLRRRSRVRQLEHEGTARHRHDLRKPDELPHRRRIRAHHPRRLQLLLGRKELV